MATPERAFLDAMVVRGQLTTDVVLSIASEGVLRPRWSQRVLDEARANRPPGLSEAAIDHRFRAMTRAFPDAMVTGHEHLIPEMPADDKDRHVLAAALHSNSHVLVTENDKDFRPPGDGPGSIRVERTSHFLGRLLDENPREVTTALNAMVGRNQREPRTMPELIDRMVNQQDLAEFARKLNATLPPQQQGTDPQLASGQERTASSVALDGLADARGAAQRPGTTPEVRQKASDQGVNRGPDQER
jgi:hypothetical protein